MKYLIKSPFFFLALVLIALRAGMQPAYADVEQECRQEAQEYGFDTELANQYISDCLLTRGGIVPADTEPAREDELPVNPDEQPTGEVELPSGELELPSGELELPSGEVELPSQ
jgi:hypothetical protein